MNFHWNCTMVFLAGKNFLLKKSYEFQKNFRTVTYPWSSATSWCRPWSTLTRSTQTSGSGSPLKSMRDSPLDCFRLEQRVILNSSKKNNFFLRKETSNIIIKYYGTNDLLKRQNYFRKVNKNYNLILKIFVCELSNPPWLTRPETS